MTPELFETIVVGWIAIAAAIFGSLFFIAAPYGRYARAGWGPRISAKLSWAVMEAVSPATFAILFALGKNRGPAAIAFLALWEAHYLHRAFIYPFTLKNPHPMPVSITAMAMVFNLANAFLNGYFLFFLADRPAAWLADPRFAAGSLLFSIGFVVNRWADTILRKLRGPGETAYKIPRGGPYELVSSPNYLGEIVEWCGWALLTWSLAGLSFATWTVANLAPRARSNHRWYRETFPDYPRSRRALLPFIW